MFPVRWKINIYVYFR